MMNSHWNADVVNIPTSQEIDETPTSINAATCFYEVQFKCSVDIYITEDKYQYGDMVLVTCERGYNIGFVSREVGINEFVEINQNNSLPPKKIISHLHDEDKTIRKMLIDKIAGESYVLAQCKSHVKGRKLGVFSDIVSTEFQFDRNKLMVYIKKYEDVSVCRLVRKLYDTFKIRIKVYEVENTQILYDMALKYHELSKLDLPVKELFSLEISATPPSAFDQNSHGSTRSSSSSLSSSSSRTLNHQNYYHPSAFETNSSLSPYSSISATTYPRPHGRQKPNHLRPQRHSAGIAEFSHRQPHYPHIFSPRSQSLITAPLDWSMLDIDQEQPQQSQLPYHSYENSSTPTATDAVYASSSSIPPSSSSRDVEYYLNYNYSQNRVDKNYENYYPKKSTNYSYQHQRQQQQHQHHHQNYSFDEPTNTGWYESVPSAYSDYPTYQQDYSASCAPSSTSNSNSSTYSKYPYSATTSSNSSTLSTVAADYVYKSNYSLELSSL